MKRRDFSGPIVIGVDPSKQSARAAAFGRTIARAFGRPAHHVLAYRDRWAAIREVALNAAASASATSAPDPKAWSKPLTAEEKDAAREPLRDFHPDDVDIIVERGRPARVLSDYAERVGASLLVVGGKRHSTLGRWVMGSTANHLVRTTRTPLLVVGDEPVTPSRILVAVDLSPFAPAVLAFAQELAGRTESPFLAIHAVDETPLDADDDSGVTPELLMAGSEQLAEERLWSVIDLPHAEHAIVKGPPGECIREQAKSWGADLVVLGSHGHGYDGRALLGGTTEGLIDDLPTSILVYPVDTSET